ncbi:hypothetical protein K503DRAFT_802819 [Rhizopogon vinicolor AM-OR11-026]|uniref:Uncharacterized protein n=1 Tax=Rhizopogon vinicolor AM-OR11-026 TaxID=1314800 RepID=A0A1B7MSB9_9AGAM|nr:hypothetical protein K503DRAFT_802819 [Rhizopogon vinicolor AM-OR11-026]
MDAYGTFSDHTPSGFDGVSTTFAPPPSDPAVPQVSRTMQYADTCAAVQASLATTLAAPPTSYTGVGVLLGFGVLTGATSVWMAAGCVPLAGASREGVEGKRGTGSDDAQVLWSMEGSPVHVAAILAK